MGCGCDSRSSRSAQSRGQLPPATPTLLLPPRRPPPQGTWLLPRPKTKMKQLPQHRPSFARLQHNAKRTRTTKAGLLSQQWRLAWLQEALKRWMGFGLTRRRLGLGFLRPPHLHKLLGPSSKLLPHSLGLGRAPLGDGGAPRHHRSPARGGLPAAGGLLPCFGRHKPRGRVPRRLTRRGVVVVLPPRRGVEQLLCRTRNRDRTQLNGNGRNSAIMQMATCKRSKDEGPARIAGAESTAASARRNGLRRMVCWYHSPIPF